MPPPARLGLWFGVFVLGISSIACADDSVSEQGSVYFETHIRPLFVRYCYQCHSEKAGEVEGGLLLDRRSGWLEGGERGPSVIPGDPDASPLIHAVRFEEPDLAMPPSEPLPAAEIRLLEQWVRLGAPGPLDGQVATVDDPSDPVSGRSHWAFQPLRTAAPPPVRDVSWPRGPIDRFILAGLEDAGLQPAADAGRQQLLRRISFHLTGLPPSTNVSSLLVDDAGLALWPRLVDRLLAAPQFGQVWGRHWLDLARYADSNGLDENFLFREAWRYRNWVIDATNVDLSYDRFLTEQIAGDLLPWETIEQRDHQRVGAGFMVIGPKVLLGIDKDQQRMDIADEHIDTIGRAVLGQTLGCARCHDHKFDPIPTADYYALAGIFTSTRVMEKRHMLGQQRVMEQLVGLGADGSDLDEAYETYWRDLAEMKARKTDAEKALKLLEENKADEFAKQLKEHQQAVSAIAGDSTKTMSERIADQQAYVAELKQAIENPPPIPPRAMVPADVDQPANEAIRLAGQFDELGAVVPRGFLSVLGDAPLPTIAADESGRLALASWLTDKDTPAGHLAARVLANRIWRHLIGRGLVRTVDNFGRTGETPTHPELLDYLASQLIESGWSIKSLVREIVLSHTFAMSSRYDANSYARDPENKMLWRAHRRRLEPEAIRDAMLAAAGRLDQSQFASTVAYLGDQATAVGENKNRRRTDFPCRSVYLPIIRNDLPEIFEAFDFANPHTTTGARPQTIVPSQGLYILNDEAVMDAAQATAERILNECAANDLSSQIDRMFEIIFSDTPTDAERASVAAFLKQAEAEISGGSVTETTPQPLAVACHALFAASRFQFLE